ncbi:MAG: M48 family metalloprotease [Casimicrobiaceae bacterium]
MNCVTAWQNALAPPPLMAILSPEERIAVMAHELSHGANGDPLRGTFLSGAVNTLVT